MIFDFLDFDLFLKYKKIKFYFFFDFFLLDDFEESDDLLELDDLLDELLLSIKYMHFIHTI